MTEMMLAGTPVKTRMRALLAYKLGWQLKDIHEEQHLVNELYVDSLDLVEIEIGISETFNVQLSENDLLAVETVADLCHLVEGQLSENMRVAAHSH